MMYSKLLKPSHLLLNCRFNSITYFSTSVKHRLLRNQIKVSSSSAYVNRSHYSTILCLKLSDHQKLTSDSPIILNSASVSTNVNNDKYEIIITDPKGTLESSIGSSLNKATNPEVLSTPVGDATDIATSLPNELATAVDLIEPSFASLDLCHWTPPGVIQMFLEYLHCTNQWPWWLTIITCTVVARILLFPLLLKTQKNAISMGNYMPQLQYLQAKFGEARRAGNSLEASRLAAEIVAFMKDHNISPIKNAMLPMLQAPVFLSFFFALRGMAKAPVESMKTGGISWVTDLTIPDPYYILPVLSCGTLYVILKIGAESGVRLENMKMAKYAMQALPVVALPFCINFPSAILYYWCTNNFCTLVTVSILKINPVREYFNLPVRKPVDPKYALPNKGFVKGFKDALEDQKVLANIEDRRKIDSMKFQKAGTGPIPRTYSYDPTKPRPSNVASLANRNMAAKERKV